MELNHNSWLCWISPAPDQPEWEPVEYLHEGDDAEPQEEAEEAADLRYEVEQGH